jgi:hypothetical protein
MTIDCKIGHQTTVDRCIRVEILSRRLNAVLLQENIQSYYIDGWLNTDTDSFALMQYVKRISGKSAAYVFDEP